jgi:hypothetical protein
MRELPLSLGYVALVDDADWPTVCDIKWFASPRNSGAVYAYAQPKGKTVYLHRFLLDARPEHCVDHVNRNPLDNRRSNLRVCTRGQNNANVTKSRAVSQFTGVERLRNGRWRGVVSSNYRSYKTGRFETEIEAAHARDELATRLFGEFAYLNFGRPA